jgi:hypothetical protein
MNCDGVQELLSAYVDGELSSGELLRVEQHLRRCPVCAEEIDALRQTVAFVALLPEVELPAGFREGLRARLAEVKPQLQPVRPVAPLRPAWNRQVARWIMPAAAAAALALVSTGAYGRLGTTLFGKAADPNPTKAVVTPAVTYPTNPVGTTEPGPVASNHDPKPPGPGVTDPNQGGPKSDDPGPDISHPHVDVPPPPHPDDANPDTPKGPGQTDGGPAVASSLIDQVKAPSKWPAQLYFTTTMQAIVPDLAQMCNLLKSDYDGATCTPKESGQMQVTFSVAADKATAAQAQVTAIIGEGVTAETDSVDRAAQIQAAYERVATLSEDIDKLKQLVATTKDADKRSAFAASLAQKQDEGAHATTDYNSLGDQVGSHFFVIDLQKQGQ